MEKKKENEKQQLNLASKIQQYLSALEHPEEKYHTLAYKSRVTYKEILQIVSMMRLAFNAHVLHIFPTSPSKDPSIESTSQFLEKFLVCHVTANPEGCCSRPTTNPIRNRSNYHLSYISHNVCNLRYDFDHNSLYHFSFTH